MVKKGILLVIPIALCVIGSLISELILFSTIMPLVNEAFDPIVLFQMMMMVIIAPMLVIPMITTIAIGVLGVVYIIIR